MRNRFFKSVSVAASRRNIFSVSNQVINKNSLNVSHQLNRENNQPKFASVTQIDLRKFSKRAKMVRNRHLLEKYFVLLKIPCFLEQT